MTSSGDLVRQAKAGFKGGGSKVPRRNLALVTCMDARVDPLRALSLDLGDAHVLRTAGGVVTGDVIRSLVVSQRLVETRRVDVMMHTDCGMAGLDEAELAARIASDTGRPYSHGFRGFASLEAELRRGVERLRKEPALPHRDLIRGLVYDVETGRVRTVVE
ncbi:MAG TPA: carbonic anhydrase [Acidimicrobiia bacterium]|jgi:carbonic anhydrase|nr:carbonic anhydrase [Acidimicrobiia bacterium]